MRERVRERMQSTQIFEDKLVVDMHLGKQHIILDQIETPNRDAAIRVR